MATITWTSNSGTWNTPSNWSTDSVPGVSDDAVLGGSNFYTVQITGPITPVAGLSISNTGASLTFADIATALTAGDLDNGGLVGVDYQSNAGGSSLSIGGTLDNTGFLEIGESALTASTVVTAAALQNTGSIFVTGNKNAGTGNSATLDITSGAAPAAIAGELSVAGDSLVEFASGQIGAIDSGATLSIDGPNAFIADSGSTGSDSAVGVTSNAGTFQVQGGASVNTGAPLTNTGSVDINVAGSFGSGTTTLTVASLDNTGSVTLNSQSNSPTADALLDVTGAAPTVLTGSYYLNDNTITFDGVPEPTGPEIVEFGGGSVDTIAPGTTLELLAPFAYFSDAGNPTGNGALSDLSLNEGTVELVGTNLATTTGLTNLATLQFTGGATVSIGGSVTNFGTFKAESYSAGGATVVSASNVQNFASVIVAGGGTGSATLDIAAVAPTTLTGTWAIGEDYDGGNIGPAVLEYGSGGIGTIGAGGTLFLAGAQAFVADSGASGSSSALTDLSLNEGTLQLWAGATLSTDTGLVNLAAVDVDDPHNGGSSLTVGGVLTNDQTLDIGASDAPAASTVTATGLISYGSIFLQGSSATKSGTLQINGNAFDYGPIDIRANSALDVTGTFTQFGNFTSISDALSAASVALVGGEIDVAGTLTAPSVNVEGGVIEGLGTITGNVDETAGIIYGGTLATNYSYNYGFYDPGTTGTLTIDGNFAETGASVVAVLRGTSTVSTSTIAVDGGVTLNGGILQIDSGAGSDSYGVTFQAGEVFTLMMFTPGELSGTFAAIQDDTSIGNGDSVDLGNGLTLEVVYNNSAGNIQLDVVNTPTAPTGDVVVDSGNYGIGAPTSISGSLIFASTQGTLSIDDPFNGNATGPIYTPMGVTVGGSLSNAGQMEVDYTGPYATPGGTALSIAGTFDNGGNLTIGTSGADADTTITAAALVNTGEITLLSNAPPPSTNPATLTTLDITGTAGFGFAGIVTGAVNLFGNDAATGQTLIEFGSGQITTIAAGASISLHGKAIVADAGNTGSNSALIGLTDNFGSFQLLDGDSVTTDTDLTNTGSLAIDDDGPYAVSGGSSLTVGGTLTNTGSVSLGNGSTTVASALGVQALVNTGDLTVAGAPSVAATLSVGGAAGFGTAGVLTGNVTVSGQASIQFAGGGQITTIGSGSSLSIGGSDAFIDDSGNTNANSALFGLASIGGGGGPTGEGFGGGSLSLGGGADIATDTGMDNAGTINVDYSGPYAAAGGSTLSIGGTLDNLGTMMIGAGSITAASNASADGLVNTGNITIQGGVPTGGTAPGTLTINGNATNNGSITVDANGNLFIDGNLASYGHLTADGGTIAISGALSGTGTFSFSGTGGTLRIGGITMPTVSIAGLAVGDTLDFAQEEANAATFANGVLTLTESGTTVASVDLTGSYGADAFVVESDAASGTDVFLPVTTVSAGQSFTISDDETVSGITVDSGGTLTLDAGSVASSTVLSGGFLVMSSGGTETGRVSGGGTVAFATGSSVVAGTGGLVISTGPGNDTVNTLAGGDTVEGGMGSGTALVFGASGDVVENGSGAAFVTLSGVNPTIFSLSGGSALFYAGADDTLVAGGGTAVAVGAAGDDFVLGSGNDTVNVIPSGESLTFGSGNAIVYGGPGDTIGDAAGTVVDFTSGSNAIVLAGSGNSVLLYSGPGDTLDGGNAAATVIGSANDEIVLGTGADTVNAFPANEVVELGSGANETIYGGAGDTIEASGGSPIVMFVSGSQGIVFVESAGAEQLYSGPGDTLVIGGGTLAVIGAAGDTLTLGSGTDTVNALPPNETVTLGTGNATVFGGDGDTIGDASGTVVTFTGGNSVIAVEGTNAAVTVSDGAGDTIAAGSAAATIAGAKNSAIVLGAANDTVTGANGDTVTTGAGSDSIDLGASHTAAEFLAPGGGSDSGANDTVVNFNQSLGDRIVETGQAETNTIASAHSSGGNTTFTLADGSTVTLVGVSSISSNFFS